MQLSSPWTMVESSSVGDHVRAEQVVYLCAEALRICGILLQPYMPTKAGELLDMLGVATDKRSFAVARVGADAEYGTSKLDLGKGHDKALFPPLRSNF